MPLSSLLTDAATGADRLVDHVLPDDFDWRRMVRDYPLPALFVAGVGGFVVGRSHGAVLLSALSTFALQEVTSHVESLLGR